MPAGTHLSLDISTLYLVATLAAAMLGVLLLFFWRQEKSQHSAGGALPIS
jgi:hypothetical protein